MTEEEIRESIEGNDSVTMVTKYEAFEIDTDSIDFSEYSVHLWDCDEYTFEEILFIGRGTRMTEHFCTLGCDPEFFFKKGGKVIPSRRVVPRFSTSVTRDGFQGEINPDNNVCREVTGENIADALEEAEDMAQDKGAELAFSVGEVVDKDTFLSLPAPMRRFGCSPTANPYEDTKRVTGVREKFRSGGGHIHMGGSMITRLTEQQPEKLIKLLDIVCGNTCVLIDRDEANITRRKHYGRAGEHRMKSYGLEYRVPSNFWLRHYMLWSMVTGLARNAMWLTDHKIGDEIIEKISTRKVRKAINENNKELAFEVFNEYASILHKHNVIFGTGISIMNTDAFIRWASKKNPIDSLGVNTVEQSLEVWRDHRDNSGIGFERGLTDLV